MGKRKQTSSPNGQLLKSTKTSKTRSLSVGKWPGFLSSPVTGNVFVQDGYLWNGWLGHQSLSQAVTLQKWKQNKCQRFHFIGITKYLLNEWMNEWMVFRPLSVCLLSCGIEPCLHFEKLRPAWYYLTILWHHGWGKGHLLNIDISFGEPTEPWSCASLVRTVPKNKQK